MKINENSIEIFVKPIEIRKMPKPNPKIKEENYYFVIIVFL